MKRSDVLHNMSCPPRTIVESRVVAVHRRPVAFCLGFFINPVTRSGRGPSRMRLPGPRDGSWSDLQKRLALSKLRIAEEPVLPAGLTAVVIGWGSGGYRPGPESYDRCSDPALTLAVLSRTVGDIFFAHRPPDYDWDHCLTRTPVFFDDPGFHTFPLEQGGLPDA
jgi:hypothetical protein